MSVSSAKGITNIQFGGFYLPTLSWGYLYLQSSNDHYLWFAGICLIGALMWHAIYKNIYGHGGPRENPKNKWVVRGYFVAFHFMKTPRKAPESITELRESVISGATRLRAVRGLVLGSISIGFWFLTLYVLIPLFGSVSSDSHSLAGGLLLFANVTFLLKSVVWKRFATLVTDGSEREMYVPEYRRAHRKYEEEEFELESKPGILDEIREIAESIRNLEKDPYPDEVEYLVPLEENPDYLISLEDEKKEGYEVDSEMDETS